MKTTDRFLLQRRDELKAVLAKPILVKTWRKIVRQQMRSMDILDLHDYYDFNYHINERAQTIEARVLSGQYKCHVPLTYTVEKKLGVCRHMTLPNPSDALVLQAIVEGIGDKVRATEKTGKAFYSRDKHNMMLPHEAKLEDEYGLHWTKQWRRFQKEILKFSKEHEYLVVTDLTNYFDNIGLRELRHIISSRVEANEVTLDFLFNLIEQLSWSPDYLPTSLKGLPTIALEAPRLLAHSLLFEVDEIIDKRTDGCFVRWMDDINFGAESIDNACRILGSVNDVLKSRGLALNLGKTAIYDPIETEQHFMIIENNYLDDFENRRVAGEKKGLLAIELQSNFKKHLKNRHLQNWSKVNKRYLTAASKLKTTRLLDSAVTFFTSQPGIRGNVSFYLRNLGPIKRTKFVALKLLNETNFYDDVSLFYLVKTVTDWTLKRSKEDKVYIAQVYAILSDPESIFELYCLLWFLSKYGSKNQIYLTSVHPETANLLK